MKGPQISILLYGQDAHLLETRKWVLQSRGYRVLTVLQLSEIELLPLTPAFALLIRCHSLSDAEGEAATALASARWPAIKSLILTADKSRSPTGLLGQLLHTMGGPANLLAQVAELVGRGSAPAKSHIY
jgi:hypothetical protein